LESGTIYPFSKAEGSNYFRMRDWNKAPSIKTQIPNRAVTAIGFWDLEIIWILGLGAWDFDILKFYLR
jgi:hypothetical protein